MGYTTKDIALIFEPKRVSLAALANFVQFKSKPGVKTYLEANINISAPTGGTNWPVVSVLRFTEPSGVVHVFSGTTVAEDAGGSVYFVDADRTNTAENLRQALLADKWINANFEVRLPAIVTGSTVANGDTLNIKSKGAGDDFDVAITAPADPTHKAYTITFVHATSTNNDSISGEASTIEICLDVYTDAPIFLGTDDMPTTSERLGNFAVTLSKTYSGDMLWFDVNGPFAKSSAFNTPPDVPGWFDTGTLRIFRFVARVAGVNNFAFYISNALYVLRGYSNASDPTDLEDYVYINEKIKLLTNKPRTNYVKGQREYLNFIFSDIDHGQSFIDNWQAHILYRAYDTLGNFIGEMSGQFINRAALNMVNTCVLDIDALLAAYPGTGLVRVALARGAALMSSDLEYTVRPSSLHTVRQFSFINKLGGWDSFNFDAAPSEEIKVTFDTFTKTVTPAHRKGDGIETVYAAQLDDALTITGAPVSDEVAEWLKEFAASTVVLDGEGNYIIKQEFSTPVSETTKGMQVPQMKYRTSETYTND